MKYLIGIIVIIIVSVLYVIIKDYIESKSKIKNISNLNDEQLIKEWSNCIGNLNLGRYYRAIEQEKHRRGL